MPKKGLISLKTNLKSLKYGDQKPYVTRDINKTYSSTIFTTELRHRAEDVERLTKMFLDRPGIQFAKHQTLLKQKVADNNETVAETVKRLSKSVLPAASIVKSIGSILAQAAVSGTGHHFINGFKADTYLKPDTTTLSEPSKLEENFNVDTDSVKPKDKPVTLVDFRKVQKSKNEDYINVVDVNTDYGKQNLQLRLKLGDQGKRDKNLLDYKISQASDELQKLTEQTTSKLLGAGADIIPFEFNIFYPGNLTGKFLYFRAHITNFSDKFSGEWAGTRYVGRAEEFFTYKSFGRTINLSFMMAAFSRDELMPLYGKLNRLAASTAPTYQKSETFMQGTLAAVTVGDYLQNQVGMINSVDIDWDKDHPWEINIEDDKNIARVPHVLSVSLQFTPIHSFNVKADIDLEKEAYIAKGKWYAK